VGPRERDGSTVFHRANREGDIDSTRVVVVEEKVEKQREEEARRE